MAFGALGRDSVLPCRSGRPRPVSFLGIVAFLCCGVCLRPRFCSQPSGGGAGGGGRASEDAEAPLLPNKGSNNQMGADGIHSNDNKNDELEKLKLQLTKILNFLASFDNHLTTIVNFHAFFENHLATILHIHARMENCMPTNQDHTTAAVVTGTPANEDAVKRKKGLLGSMCAIAEKLPMFLAPFFVWLLTNSSALKAKLNLEDPWMQIFITGGLILCFISFILMSLASKFKESESIDGVLFKIFMWLLLPVFLAPWPGLCMVMHFFAHTSKFVLWPLGILLSILSASFWFSVFYKEHEKIQEELKNPNYKSSLAQGLDSGNSYTVQISGAPSVHSVK